MPEPTPACRRCRRPLSGALAVAAGIGATCALRERLEAADGPSGARRAPDAALAAVALVTARLADVPKRVAAAIAADAEPVDVSLELAALMAYAVAETDGGPAWLRRVALTWAAANLEETP